MFQTNHAWPEINFYLDCRMLKCAFLGPKNKILPFISEQAIKNVAKYNLKIKVACDASNKPCLARNKFLFGLPHAEMCVF